MILAPTLTLFGGGIRPFSPEQITGVDAWYSADAGVLTSVGPDVPATDGQTVRRWSDRSGNGRHLDQATLLNQPLFYTAGTSGVACLRGDGSTSLMLATVPARSNATFFWAARRLSNPGSRQPWDNGGGAAPYVFHTGTLIANGSISLATNAQLQYVLGATYSTTLGRNLYKADGTEVVGSSGNMSSTTLRVFGGSSTFDHVEFSEFIRYDRFLSLQEISNVLKYLTRRWGNSL